jgi:tetratricopeptide (TPR) repeat protein
LLLIAMVAVSRADKLEPDDLQTPAPEVKKTSIQLDLPVVPAFDLPSQNADGSHSVKELRVEGHARLDSDLVVKGVITWVYDCPTAIRTAGETDKAVAKRIEDDPTLCERAKFYVGDTLQTPVEQSLWIVDVPRAFNKVELQNMPKEDLKNPPPDRCDAKAKTCPIYKVGDEVVLGGTFALGSPHSERNSDGLLVYKSMKNVTQRWETAGGVDRPSGLVRPRVPMQSAPRRKPVPLAPVKAMRAVVDPKIRDVSMQHTNAGSKFLGAKQFPDAITEFKSATAWGGNHLAWYGLGGAFAQTGNWADASAAFAHATQLRADQPMYQLWSGVALYERTVQQARESQAKKANRKPDEVVPDLSGENFDPARQRLEAATLLNPDLWRAQYYLGRIARANGRAKDAAEGFTDAIKANPREPGPYIALSDLYLKWDYVDEVIKVASQGTSNIPGANEASDIWYELGMGYDAKGQLPQAIDAFTKAIETRADNAKAKFQRGQAYYQQKDATNARRDLEDFAKSNSPGLEFAKQQANKMLMDLAAKKH